MEDVAVGCRGCGYEIGREGKARGIATWEKDW